MDLLSSLLKGALEFLTNFLAPFYIGKERAKNEQLQKENDQQKKRQAISARPRNPVTVFKRMRERFKR